MVVAVVVAVALVAVVVAVQVAALVLVAVVVAVVVVLVRPTCRLWQPLQQADCIAQLVVCSSYVRAAQGLLWVLARLVVTG